MCSRKRYSLAFLLAGLMSGIMLELSTNMPAPTARRAEGPVLRNLPTTAASNKTRTPFDRHPRIADSYGRLPLSFEVKQGQTDYQVQFLSRGNGSMPFLPKTEAVFQLPIGDSRFSIGDCALSQLLILSIVSRPSPIGNSPPSA